MPTTSLVKPIDLLLVLSAITLAAFVVSTVKTNARQRLLAGLARQWQMHFSSTDVFNLADRVAAHIPPPGAATVVVRDCVYGTEAAGHRYIFRVEYTTGVTRSKKRHWRIATVIEPRARTEPARWDAIRFADESLPIAEQYRSLRAAEPAPNLGA